MELKSVDILIILSTIIILLVVMIMVFIYSVFLKKKSQLLMVQKHNEVLFEQELSNSQIEIREQTLNYMGRELHDDLGQKISVARLLMNQIINKRKTESAEELLEVNEILKGCIYDIRNLSKTLITEQVEHFGLIDSLKLELGRIKKLNLLTVDFQYNNHDIDINSKHALILFRIIQESINNALKHSNARKLMVVVEDLENHVKVQIEDNGNGFNDKKGSKDGSGLKNILNRAKLINADLQINSGENEGTQIIISYNKF